MRSLDRTDDTEDAVPSDPLPTAASPPNQAARHLMGRSAELDWLREVYQSVVATGAPRIVTVAGAGGIGKTRLIDDFVSTIAESGGQMPRVYRGRARSQGLSYGVFARLLRARFGIVETLDTETAKGNLRRHVASVLEDRKVSDVCFFLAQLMDLPFEQSPLTRAVAEDPQQARSLRRAVVKSFFEKDSAAGPLCLVFGDLQVADEDSIDLLSYLLGNVQGRILLVMTVRPEFFTKNPSWLDFGRGHHDKLELGPLRHAEAETLMRELLASCEGGPPEALVEAGVNIAGGNPGLLEGMVRIFQDSGVLRDKPGTGGGVWRVDIEKLASVRMPLTVDEAVALRVAALSPADRRLLELCATVGSVFWLGVVVTLTRLERDAPEFWREADAGDADGLRAALEDLTRRDYVLRLTDSAVAGETEYVFKHNLEREKVSALVSASARQYYHQTIADWLSKKEHVRSQEEYSAMLARHLEQAGSFTRAGLTFLESGDIARAHYAAKKAHEYYAKGLQLLGRDDAPRRIDALHNHGDVLLMLGKTDEALAAFREMLKLAYQFVLIGKGGAAHNRIGRVYRDTGQLALARTHLDTALGLFQHAGDQRGIAASHDDIGMLHWVKGEYDHALKHLKLGLEMRKEIADRRSIALSLNNIGVVWMDHGQDRKAAEALEASLKIRREVNDPLGVVQSLNNLGRLAQEQHDEERALELYNEAYEVASYIGEHNRIAVVLTNLGQTYQRLGNSTEAIRILKQAEGLCDELGDRLHLAEAKRGLAKAYLQDGDLLRARQCIKHAVDLFGQVRSRVHLAAALRTLGEVTGAGAWGEGHEGKAVDYFMRSIAITKEIGNEIETAKSYRAFSNYVTSSPHYRANEDIQREALKLQEMADEIFERHRLGATATS